MARKWIKFRTTFPGEGTLEILTIAKTDIKSVHRFKDEDGGPYIYMITFREDIGGKDFRYLTKSQYDSIQEELSRWEV